jgi:hypothetical protein
MIILGQDEIKCTSLRHHKVGSREVTKARSPDEKLTILATPLLISVLSDDACIYL